MSRNERALIFSMSDCASYLAGTTLEPEGLSDAVTMLRAPDGKIRKFPSAYRAQEALKEMGFERGWLVMQSPYDEMIGNVPAAQKTELPLVFSREA